MSHTSLCVLAYNRPRFLEECLRSLHISATPEHPIEVIVHDDGSTDPEQRQLLAALHQQGLTSTVILNSPGHNEGRGIAMNRCAAVATGDPLCFIDQDLVFEPGWLGDLHAILAKAPTDGALIPVRGPNSTSRWTLVDEADRELAEMYRWKLNTGYAAVVQHDPTLYAEGKQSQVVVPLHRLLCQPSMDQEVDHRNRRRLDNRRRNIQACTVAENRRNVGANRGSSSPYRGVSWNDRLGKWVGQAQVAGTTWDVGVYDGEVEAAWACEEARQHLNPDSRPDPVLIPGDEVPPIGMLSGFHYWHDPCDWRRTIRARYDGWEQHEYVMGSFMAIPRVVWEALGPFEERSDAFAEDHMMMRKITGSGLWVCATPEVDLMRNVGYGLGPSTVAIPGPDGSAVTATIHHGPRIYGP